MPDAARRASRATWLALALALAVALLHGATARPTHPWSGLDDFTAYLLHGRNLLAGSDYEDMGDLRDPLLPEVHLRKAFPPVYPWVLAQLDRLAPPPDPELGSPLGVNLLLLKRALALCFAVQLFLLFLVFRRLVGDVLALLVLVLQGASAFLFHFREFLRSESLFGLILAALFLCMVRLDEQPARSARRWGLALLAGVLGWMAYGTRTAGMVVPLAILTHELWIRRRVRAPVLLALGVMGMGMLIQSARFSAVIGGYVGYAQEHIGPGVMLDNARRFLWELERVFAEGLPEPVRLGAVLVFGALAALGLCSRLRRPSLPEVFVAGSVAMHLLLPTQSAWLRYLVPLLPVFVLLMLVGARWLGRRLRDDATGDVLALAVGVLMLGLSVPGYLAQSGGPLPDGPGTPAAREALQWIREGTQPDAVVGMRKPWSLALATGRPALLYPLQHVLPDLSVEEHLAHLQRMRVRWLLLRHRPASVVMPYKTLDYDDRAGLEQVVLPHPERFVERARNAEFALFEVVPG